MPFQGSLCVYFCSVKRPFTDIRNLIKQSGKTFYNTSLAIVIKKLKTHTQMYKNSDLKTPKGSVKLHILMLMGKKATL